MKEKTIIECIRAIDKAYSGAEWRKKRESQDSDVILKEVRSKAGEELEYLCGLLNFSEIQVLMLIALVRTSARYGRCDESEIARIIGIDYLEFFSFTSELEGLKNAGYIILSPNNGCRITAKALKAIRQNKPLEPEQMTGLDITAILNRLKGKLDGLKTNEFEMADFVSYMDQLFSGNKDNSLSATYRKYIGGADDSERTLINLLVSFYWFNEDDNVNWMDVEDYYSEDDLAVLRNRYKNESLSLQKKGVIEPVTDGGIFSRDGFHIKDDIKAEFFKDLGYTKEKKADKVSASALIKASDINAKELYFSKEQQKQIDTLEDLFEENRLKSIMESLRKRGMRTGFSCLFYGAPGTGKTESVYQMARKSGRDIFMIDVSKIKSCWVGESEKNIRRVFDQYRECVKNNSKTPILLFNEADAIFGIRQNGAERAVDKMENSIQNIILQEMENLEGILIATTNLTGNFDRAFERRFLYKLRFSKPDTKTKSLIWRSMIPELKASQAKKLAEEFDFSGGQIENISRKKTVEALIRGKEPTFSQIREMCKAECISDKAEAKRKIGY
jgi:SpoVK/Ycf46/Vps4 family AAA+-type ATPase